MGACSRKRIYAGRHIARQRDMSMQRSGMRMGTAINLNLSISLRLANNPGSLSACTGCLKSSLPFAKATQDACLLVPVVRNLLCRSPKQPRKLVCLYRLFKIFSIVRRSNPGCLFTCTSCPKSSLSFAKATREACLLVPVVRNLPCRSSKQPRRFV